MVEAMRIGNTSVSTTVAANIRFICAIRLQMLEATLAILHLFIQKVVLFCSIANVQSFIGDLGQLLYVILNAEISLAKI